MMNLRMWFDGSCVPMNPARTIIGGCLIKNEKNEVIFKESYLEEHEDLTSCNHAEYVGLRLGIDWIKKNKEQIKSVKIYGDSQIVIYQMLGKFRIKDGKMYTPEARRVLKTIQDHSLFEKLDFFWIPREENQEADALTR